MVDKTGVRPDLAKVKAIQKVPIPKNVSDVRRFLGMVNQLGKFSPNLAEKPDHSGNSFRTTKHGCGVNRSSKPSKRSRKLSPQPLFWPYLTRAERQLCLQMPRALVSVLSSCSDRKVEL